MSNVNHGNDKIFLLDKLLSKLATFYKLKKNLFNGITLTTNEEMKEQTCDACGSES